jgi:hypothetical protein
LEAGRLIKILITKFSMKIANRDIISIHTASIAMLGGILLLSCPGMASGDEKTTGRKPSKESMPTPASI